MNVGCLLPSTEKDRSWRPGQKWVPYSEREVVNRPWKHLLGLKFGVQKKDVTTNSILRTAKLLGIAQPCLRNTTTWSIKTPLVQLYNPVLAASLSEARKTRWVSDRSWLSSKSCTTTTWETIKWEFGVSLNSRVKLKKLVCIRSKIQMLHWTNHSKINSLLWTHFAPGVMLH